MATEREVLVAVIGRSESGEPTLYHLTTTERAERLRGQRQRMTGGACYVVPFAAWQANPLTALQRAEQAATVPS